MMYFKQFFFQVNLEYLARVAFSDSDVIYPDSVVGTGKMFNRIKTEQVKNYF